MKKQLLETLLLSKEQLGGSKFLKLEKECELVEFLKEIRPGCWIMIGPRKSRRGSARGTNKYQVMGPLKAMPNTDNSKCHRNPLDNFKYRKNMI